jgi:hypothetical protein
MFEVLAASDDEQEIARREAADKLAAAVYDVRQEFGDFLFKAADIQEFRTRVALVKNDMMKVVDRHVPPVSGVMGRIATRRGSILERQFKAFKKGAPFADYDNFADCTSKNSDKGNPDAYCGEIKHRTEDKTSRTRTPSTWRHRPRWGGDSISSPEPTPSLGESGTSDAETDMDPDQLKHLGWYAVAVGPEDEYQEEDPGYDGPEDEVYPADAIGVPPGPPDQSPPEYQQQVEPVTDPGGAPPPPPPSGGYVARRQPRLHFATGDGPAASVDGSFQDHQGQPLIPEDHYERPRSIEQGAGAVDSNVFVPGEHDKDYTGDPSSTDFVSGRESHRRRSTDEFQPAQPDSNFNERDYLTNTRQQLNEPGGWDKNPMIQRSLGSLTLRYLSFCRSNGLPPTLAALERHGKRLPPDQYLVIAASLDKLARLPRSRKAQVVQVVDWAIRQAGSQRRTAAPDFLQKAKDALEGLLNQKAEEFQEGIAPLQQAYQVIQQSQMIEQAQNPMGVQPPAGTVNVLPDPPQGLPGADPAAAGGGAPADQSAPPPAADAAGLAGQPPDPTQQMQMAARRRQGGHPKGQRRQGAGVVDKYRSWMTKRPDLERGNLADVEAYEQEQGPLGPRARHRLTEELGVPEFTAAYRAACAVFGKQVVDASRRHAKYTGSGDVEDKSGPFAGKDDSFPVGTPSDLDDAKSVCNFPSVKSKNPGACNKVDKMQKPASRKQAWMGWGPAQIDHHPRVAGWDWDSHLEAYTAQRPGRFACSCGNEMDMPGHHECKCGRLWNGYVIGTGGQNHEASAEKYLVREIPVRPDVIVANKQAAPRWSPDPLKQPRWKTTRPSPHPANDREERDDNYRRLQQQDDEGLGDYHRHMDDSGVRREGAGDHEAVDADFPSDHHPSVGRQPATPDDWAHRNEKNDWTSHALPRRKRRQPA